MKKIFILILFIFFTLIYSFSSYSGYRCLQKVKIQREIDGKIVEGHGLCNQSYPTIKSLEEHQRLEHPNSLKRKRVKPRPDENPEMKMGEETISQNSTRQILRLPIRAQVDVPGVAGQHRRQRPYPSAQPLSFGPLPQLAPVTSAQITSVQAPIPPLLPQCDPIPPLPPVPPRASVAAPFVAVPSLGPSLAIEEQKQAQSFTPSQEQLHALKQLQNQAKQCEDEHRCAQLEGMKLHQELASLRQSAQEQEQKHEQALRQKFTESEEYATLLQHLQNINRLSQEDRMQLVLGRFACVVHFSQELIEERRKAKERIQSLETEASAAEELVRRAAAKKQDAEARATEYSQILQQNGQIQQIIQQLQQLQQNIQQYMRGL